jgi:hypothetical protein
LWTPLHAAAFQEHGKVVMTLLAHGADALAEDAKQRTPKDFATISEAIWPFFQASGCVRTGKPELVLKGIVRKVEPRPAEDAVVVSGMMVSPVSTGGSTIPVLSRPGSAYVRVAIDPMRPPTAVDRSGRAVGGYAGFARVSTPAGSVSPGTTPCPYPYPHRSVVLPAVDVCPRQRCVVVVVVAVAGNCSCGMRCDAMRCDAMRCDAMRCDAMRCDAMRCDAMRVTMVAV